MHLHGGPERMQHPPAIVNFFAIISKMSLGFVSLVDHSIIDEMIPLSLISSKAIILIASGS